jgi:oligopeptide/dipeptide ABC transporter ATP-binding protein
MACAPRWIRAMNEAALLVVDGLSVSYGDAAAVEAVTLEIAPGRCLGVIGESGAGKTQAFLAMMGLLPPQARVAGRALLEGADLLGADAVKLRGQRIAMIFQDPMTALTPHMRIGDQIAEPLVTHRGMSWPEARGRAATLLDQVRMSDVPRRLRQYPHELSGGMRQRAMIAMALACDPKLLIADEPTTALDVSVQAQILALLRQLVAERGMSLAVITHDMGVIAALADDVVVMNGGRIVERGPVSRILEAPEHEYTRSLLAATPRVDTPGAGASLSTAQAAATNPLSVRDLRIFHKLRNGWLRPATELRAVDGVSLDLAAGEALGIVGESGCGKSTLTRALMRLGPVTGGQIVWLGQAIESIEGEALRRLRAGLQIVFQDPFASLDPVMNVADIVAEPLRALRPGMDATQRGAAVERMLTSVGLGPQFMARRSRELSGGQCQRVAIARAMILEPKLLVCDEAVSALDVSVQAQLLQLFESIKRDHRTSIVFVSHNLAVVRRLCERVLVMYLGRVVEEGPTEEVFRAPRHPYTRMLLESVPLLDPDRARARLATRMTRGETPSAVDRPSGCGFRTRCPAAVDICASSRPEPEAVTDSHQVACLRWRQL